MMGKERLMAAARGEVVDHLPWAPRIDMWYNAHKRNSTLPPQYRDATIWDVIRDVGGDVYFNSGPIYKEILHGVEIVEEILNDSSMKPQEARDRSTAGADVTYGQERLSWNLRFPPDRRVYYHTPVGTVSARYLFNEDMELTGVTVPYQVEHWIKRPADYPVVEYIVEHAEYVPQHDEYCKVAADIGDDAVVFGFTDYSPFHRIMREWLGYEMAIFELRDHPELVEHLHALLSERYQEIMQFAIQSPAEIVQIDSNWNTVISPRIFRRYFLPYCQEFSLRLHEAGKLASTHCDGEMKHLFALHNETGLDIVECLTPAPMCQFTLAEARAAYGNTKTIWGGLPAVVFSGLFPDADFDLHMEEVGRAIAPGRRMVLAMGDNLPIDARLDRLFWITDWASRYPVV